MAFFWQYTEQKNDLSVYIHIPFCKRRCLYCDFVSTTDKRLITPYLIALEKDIKADSYLPEMRVRTVYFGGGTPSFVKEDIIENIFEWIVEEAGSVLTTEATIELNPESTTRKKAKRYISIGFTRASLGIQAFDDEVLELSGRPHGTKEAEKAAAILREEFENLNADFIIGLPGMTMKTVEKNLKFIERHQPDHVSVYTLEFHEEAPLSKLLLRKSLRLPAPDEVNVMFEEMMRGLHDMGYKRYEISNFAKEKKESQHNLAYWKNKNYLGFGVSAGGHVGNHRYVKTKNIMEYLKDPTKMEYESFNDDCQEMKETLFMGLRLMEGVSINEMLEKFGRMFKKFFDEVKELDFFEVKGGRLKLNEKGLRNLEKSFELIVGLKCHA